jgi:hypothetical protein
MKRFLTLMTLIVCITGYNAFGQSQVSILDFKGQELDILLNINDNQFNEYLTFQYENLNFDFLSQYSDFTLLSKSKETIVIKCDRDTLILSIIPGRSQYLGFGITDSKADNYTLTLNPSPACIIDLISVNGHQIPFGSITCDSGGEGSSGCSTESSTIGSASCSVTCRDGYYACCDKDNICRCIKIGAAKTFKRVSYVYY